MKCMHILLGSFFLLAVIDAPAAEDCEAKQTPIVHSFDTGAQWTGCWHVDKRYGLVLSHLAYAPPGQTPRKVIRELHLAGLFTHYDNASEPEDVITQYGLDSENSRLSASEYCPGQALMDATTASYVCRQLQYKNTLTRYLDNHIQPRRTLKLSMPSKIGALIWEHSVELTEDGTIEPAINLSGRINRFSIYPAEGTRIFSNNDSKFPERYAISATLIAVWRLDIEIAGTALNDKIDQIQFEPDDSPGVRRRMTTTAITTESRHQVNAERFRGWRLSDSEVSAGVPGNQLSQVGYYLDPQSSAYRYFSHRFNWARYDFFVTEHQDCERTVVNNSMQNSQCADSLDEFIDSVGTDPLQDPVVWFAMYTRLNPTIDDWPALNTRSVSFKLTPFDWSAQSQFQSSQGTLERSGIPAATAHSQDVK